MYRFVTIAIIKLNDEIKKLKLKNYLVQIYTHINKIK